MPGARGPVRRASWLAGEGGEEGKVGEIGREAGRAGVEVTVADFRYTDQAKWEGDVVVEGSQMTGVPRGGLDRELGRIRWGDGRVYRKEKGRERVRQGVIRGKPRLSKKLHLEPNRCEP